MQKENQLLTEIQNAVKESITEKKIGIAFSGGVDSTLVSKICKDLEFDITLLTIGFPDSHDISFAKDVNEILNFTHEISKIDHDSFNEIASKINKKLILTIFHGMKIVLRFIMLQS